MKTFPWALRALAALLNREGGPACQKCHVSAPMIKSKEQPRFQTGVFLAYSVILGWPLGLSEPFSSPEIITSCV